MSETTKAVGITADGLVALRAGPLAKSIGVNDPFANWFVTDEGRKMAAMAMSVDGVYEPFNLARYRRTSEALTRHAGRLDQMVLLGSGFDGRALWLEGLREGRVTVYEAETPAKLEEKREALRRQGIAIPPWNRHVPCDLRDPGVNGLLQSAGFQSGKPTLVLAEGLFYYLPPEIVTRILDPNWLRLEKGSVVMFDCWSEERIDGLNRSVFGKTGKRLFQSFPIQTDPETLRRELLRMGYAEVSVTPLHALAEQYFGKAFADPYHPSWWIVEAIV